MKTVRGPIAVFLSLGLLLGASVPARADFRYTETSQVTGGSLIKMMKAVSIFARGDAKKQEKQMLEPVATTHYVKGGRLRTDNSDGTIEIIDIDGQRVIAIDTNKKTYGVATFDQIKAAMQQAQQQVQAQMQQNAQNNPQPAPETKDAQVKITPTIHVTPGTSNRVILNQPTNETKVQMDMAMQVTATGQDAPPADQPNSGTATMAMNVDSFVAPGVSGYLQFAEFYRRMAKDVDWMTLPAMTNIQIADPRVSEGMAELQKNSDAMKGFPMLSYVTMSLVLLGPDGKPLTSDSQSDAQKQQASTPAPAQSSNSDNTIPTSASDLAVKSLGSLFGKKKDKDKDKDTSSNSTAAPPNPNPDPNALMEMTTQVTTFSDSTLDGSLFDIPAGFTQVQEDPMQVLGGGRSEQQTPQKK
jgi:hypothetical protein